MNRPTLSDLDGYLERYGAILGQQGTEAIAPLHVPGEDAIDPGVDELLRQPFEPQAHLITAGVKALRRQKSFWCIAETGTGKTLVSEAIVHCHAAGRPYKAIVMCPGQLCLKHERELRSTIAGVRVTQIERWQDCLPLLRRPENADPWWFIIARDRAKLGYKRKDGYATRLMLFESADGSGKRWARTPCCADCGAVTRDDDGIIVTPTAAKPSSCKECGAALWQASSQLRRMEPAKLLHKKLKGWFDYFVIDEAHEVKSSETAQANAAGSLSALCKRSILLTGTLIGGYADHIRPLLFRFSPRSVIAEGLGWKDVMPFNQRYGRIDTIVKEKSGGGYDNTMSRGKKSVTKVVRPGIMPSLFGRHLIGNAAFLSLDEVSDALPELQEEVIPCRMDSALAEEYGDVEEALLDEIKANAFHGAKRLLGPMLNCLLTYPDYPFGWDQVGWTDMDGEWHGVVTPTTLNDVIRPKEQALIDWLEVERLARRQCWVYVLNNGVHDVQSRLERLLHGAGFRVRVMNASVPLKDREKWIEKHGRHLDVVLSHPKLVETGLDLFSLKPGGHNFCSLAFFQTGYNLFTLRQASRRAWRIGQTRPCKIGYFYYQGTMQERAMQLMGKKLVAAQALEGKFSSEGLVAMGGDDNMEMAMAKSLAERLPVNAERVWQKLGGNSCSANVRDTRAIHEGNTTHRPSKLVQVPLFDDEEELLAEIRRAM
jgi:hypothetical protein